MKHLQKLRARLVELKGILDGFEAKETLTAEDLEAINKATGEVDEIEAKIATLEKAEKAKVKMAAATTATDPNDDAEIETDLDEDQGGHPAVRAPGQPRIKEGVLKFGMVGLAVAAVKRGINGPDGKPYKDVYDVLQKNGCAGIATELRNFARARSVVAGNAAQGGILIPDAMSTEIIEFLRPSTAFLRGNPRRIPMPNGSFSQPGGATGASAQYGTELTNAEASAPTFRDIDMVAKELKALVPMSNMWLDFSIAGARAFVEQDLRMAMSETMDLNMFTGDGTQGRPTGIYKIPGIGTFADAYGTTPTYTQTDAAARAMINYMTTRNLNIGRAAWIMSVVTLGYLQDLRDANGNVIYPSLQGDNPTWKTIPVFSTTNLPDNLGATGDQSYLALVAWDHVLFGEAPGMEFSVSSEAAYYDAGGTLRSAFQRGETLLLTVMRHDVNIRHLPAVVTRTAVRWGK